MRLFLFRHGQASPHGPDSHRALTAQGRSEVTRIAEHFKFNHGPLQRLWHSPKVRAAETAHLFLGIAGTPKTEVEEKDGLNPDGDVLGIYRELTDLKAESLMLVSHLPFVADLASHLAQASPGAELTFPTAGLAAFERKGGGWKWLWSLHPSSLK